MVCAGIVQNVVCFFYFIHVTNLQERYFILQRFNSTDTFKPCSWVYTAKFLLFHAVVYVTILLNLRETI